MQLPKDLNFEPLLYVILKTNYYFQKQFNPPISEYRSPISNKYFKVFINNAKPLSSLRFTVQVLQRPPIDSL
jgi:hypothetical protein